MAWTQGEHPDLALLRQPERRAIGCLALRADAARALAALDALTPFHVYAQDGWTVLLVDGVDAPGTLTARAEALLRAANLCAGLSGPFALAASAHGCMRKAQLALATGLQDAPGRALYAMEDFAETALLHAAHETLAAQGFTREDFCDAALRDMADADAREQGCMLDSLRAYLQSGLALRAAAQTLGVHRNTLAYRMQRAQARYGLDLSDRNTCFELRFSLWLWDHLPAGALERPDAPFDAARAQAALWRFVQREAPVRDAGAPFGMALLAIGTRAMADARRDALVLALLARAPQAACAFDDDAVYLALPPDGAQTWAEDCAPLWAESRAVLTQPFVSTRLPWRARQCRDALRVAVGALTRTQDIASTLLFMTLERRIALAPYLSEDVVRVMDDDALRGASLSRALYAYLLNAQDLKRAAAQLGIHRNTMEYQMRKISALIGGAPDEQRRFWMMCTYKMLALPDPMLDS